MAAPSPSPSASAAGGEDAPRWLSGLYHSLRARNRRERDPFKGVFQWYGRLLEEEDALKRANEHLRRARFDAPSSPAAGAAPEGAHGAAALEARVRELQAELNNGYRVKAENAEAMLRLKAAAEENERALVEREEQLEQKKAQLAAAEARLEAESGRAAKLEEAVDRLLNGEVAALREQVRQCGERIKELSADNSALLDRILTMKNQQAAEMNQVNDMYEAAARNARAAEEMLRRHREESGERAAAGGAAGGIDVSGAADSSSILDAAAWQSHFNVRLPSEAARRAHAHDGQASGARFNASGSLVVTCGADSLVRLWDARSAQPRSVLRGSRQGVVCASFSPDDRMVLGSGNDHSALVWSLNTSRVLHTLTGHKGKIYASTFSLDGKLAVTGSHDRTIRLWDMGNGYSRRSLSCGSSCNYLSLSPNGDLLASAHMDKRIRFWSLRTGEAVAEVGDLHTQQATCAQFSSDGNMVATCSRDNSLRLLDVRTFKAVATLREEKGDFRSQCNWGAACFSPDGQYVAAGGADGSLFVWSAKDGTLKALVGCAGAESLGGAAGAAPAAARHRRASSASAGGSSPDAVTGVAWNKNGQQLVSACNAGDIVFWE